LRTLGLLLDLKTVNLMVSSSILLNPAELQTRDAQ